MRTRTKRTMPMRTTMKDDDDDDDNCDENCLEYEDLLRLVR